MLEKTEWPNEAKLKALRDEGVVALSPFSCRCVWTLTFLCTLWGLRGQLASVRDQVRNAFTLGMWAPADGAALAIKVARLVGIPLGAALLVTVVWALFQTKFFFRFGLLGMNFQRLSRIHFPNPASAVSRILGALIELAVFLAFGVLCARLCWTGVLYLLNNDRLYVISWFPGVLQAALVPIAILLGIFALLGWLGSKFVFLMRHRMSKAELERGVAESDVSI